MYFPVIITMSGMYFVFNKYLMNTYINKYIHTYIIQWKKWSTVQLKFINSYDLKALLTDEKIRVCPGLIQKR